jgi:hypothetical protein
MERGNRSYENMKMRIEEGKPLNLNDQMNAISKGLLPTPQSRDFRCGQAKRIGRDGKQNNLNDHVKLFPTPRNNSGPSKDKKHMSLDGFVKLWPTPRTGSNRNSRNAIIGRNTNGKHKSDMGLEQAVEVAQGILLRELETSEELPPRFRKMLPTPTARDYKDGSAESCKNVPVNGLLGRAVHQLASPQAGGQLNPDWVDVLMGYPQGWSDIENDSPKEFDMPKSWLDGTWEDGIPRVATGIKNRVNRLKCLGNAIVPQIATLIWQQIKRFEGVKA